MDVQDAVKFLYQYHMGPGHLIEDEALALARLEEEWATLSPSLEEPLFEEIGNGLCRLNLRACKGKQLSTRLIARLFVLTANAFVSDADALAQALELVYTLPFSQEIVADYLAQYRQKGCPAVHHSDRYRAACVPAYRVVSKYYVTMLPILSAIEQAMEQNSHVRVAIDGPCASGKSTLGQALADIYCCPLIHMDDFFLRPEQRTQTQLAQPGGNVDHARFSREVLAPLLENEPARYRPWRCHSGEFGPEIVVRPGPLMVVEGSYSLRPDLRDAYTLRIWVEAPWEVRRQRLLERCGSEGLARFESIWIPLENRYFSACQVKQCCQLIFPGIE